VGYGSTCLRVKPDIQTVISKSFCSELREKKHAVLQTRDVIVYPGFRILIFFIPDPTTTKKRRGKN
jgi:hypothetical protein